MVIFLYSGFIIAFIIIFILFNKQSKKIKKLKNSNINKILLKFEIIDLCIGILIISSVSYLLPLSIWFFGKKEIVPTEMVTVEKQLFPIEGDVYIKEKDSQGGGVYVVNCGSKDKLDEKIISKSSATIEEISKSSSPKYREVFLYDFKRLVNENFITKGVNDMFANIYIENSEGTFLEKKVVISLPKDYKIKQE